MPGPLVHKAAMSNLAAMLERDGIYVDVGNVYDNVRTDIDFDSHGWSMETMSGSIFDKIESIVNYSNGILRDEDVRHICHFCTDSMSVGQISNQLWGKYDDRFDALGELVITSDNTIKFITEMIMGVSGNLPPNIINVNAIKECQLVKMREIYYKHMNVCRKWNYCATKQFRTMVRESVYYGSFYAYQWVKEALK